MTTKSQFDAGQTSLSDQIQHVLRVARRHVRMDFGFVSQFEGGKRFFRYFDGIRQLLEVGDGDPISESYCGYVVQGELPSLMHDAFDNSLAMSLDATAAIPVRAHLSVPIKFSDGALFGTLCCFSSTPDYLLSEHDIEIMEICADIIAGILQSAAGERQDYLQIERMIDRVIAERAIKIVYQPIYRFADGRVVSFEALCRFPLGPARSPDKWFADAENVGRGTDLEFLAVEQAMAGFLSLPLGVSISLNLSPASIQTARFAELFDAIPLDRVILEITEHAAIECYPSLIEAIRPFRARGLRLAIDDVGAGHSSFRHVLDLSPDLIKLDMSLTRNADTDLGRRALAAAITQFSREMGCEVVAEGVETEQELVALRRVGVTKVQGYLISKPLPLDEARIFPLSGPFPWSPTARLRSSRFG